MRNILWSLEVNFEQPRLGGLLRAEQDPGDSSFNAFYNHNETPIYPTG